MRAPVALVIIPLTAAFLLPLFGRRRLVTCTLIILAALGQIVAGLHLVLAARAGPVTACIGGWHPSIGIALYADFLSASLALLTAIGMAIALSYARAYPGIRDERFYPLTFLLCAGLQGTFLTGDLFNLFVFTEITSVASYILTALQGDAKGLEGGFKYLVFGSVSSLFILLGVILLYGAGGELNLAHLGGQIWTFPREVSRVSIALLYLGYGLKMAAVPLHVWLPDAHSSAPSPVSALLSGLVVKAGAYVIMRLSFTVLDLERNLPHGLRLLLLCGLISIVAGHLLALAQQNLKRMLAYSTVAQMGYIMTGIGLGSLDAAAGAIYHIFGHFFMKAGLFFFAGIIEQNLKERSVGAIRGLAKLSPFTALGFSLNSVAIMGIPPFAGFMSKWVISSAAIELGFLPGAGVVGLGTFLSALYYFQLITLALAPPVTSEKPQPAPFTPGMELLAMLCVLVSMFLGLLHPLVLPEFKRMAQALFDHEAFRSGLLG